MFNIGSGEVLAVLAVLALLCLPIVVLTVVLRSGSRPVNQASPGADDRRDDSAGWTPET